MKIGLHDAEYEYFKHKVFPNLALMKISAYHKKNGDYVEWWNPLYRYDRVYSSKVFDFTPVDPYLSDDATQGGTGYRDIPIDRTLPDEIDNMFPEYSIYPECDYAIGYLTRGCPKYKDPEGMFVKWWNRTVDMQCAGMNIKKYRVINGMYVEDL